MTKSKNKKVFTDWERNRPFKDWYQDASKKQKTALDTSGIQMDYFMAKERDISWSRFNRLVGRAVKMIHTRSNNIADIIEYKKGEKNG